MAKVPVLEMKNIGKKYGSNIILKNVDLTLHSGEIHALLGENGAGKSTLMNILFGMPVIHSTGGFEGSVTMEGKAINIMTPTAAMEQGIGMVHQEFMLIQSFTIAENIKLNREVLTNHPVSKVLGKDYKTLDVNKMQKDARAALDTIGIKLSENQLVKGLPVGYMQFVEIAREIDKENMKVLVFDEPTAVFTESEAKTLLQTMRKIADSGVAIIFITHRLDEVMEVADTVTILRDGEVVTSKKKKDTNLVQLAELMVGRKIDRVQKAVVNHNKIQSTTLEIRNLVVDMPGERVKGVDLDIYEGEILGLGGLAGQGKIGIANGIMGLYPATGDVKLESHKLALNDPKKVLQEGLAFVSEDRRSVGLLLDESIESNIAITAIQIRNDFLKNYKLFKLQDMRKIKRHAKIMIEKLDIRCTGSTQHTRQLSGGNQQKVCIARALTLKPKILFVSEPTRGIDIGAKKLVLDLLIALKKEGMTIIITSSELGELRSVCDRIAIVTEGKVAGIVSPEASDAAFGLLMSGIDVKGGIAHER